MKAHIEVHHPNGHIKTSPISLPDVIEYDPLTRERIIKEYLRESIESMYDQTPPGTKIYLIIKSKSNDSRRINETPF